MSAIGEFRCSECGLSVKADSLAWRCHACGAVLSCAPVPVLCPGQLELSEHSIWRYKAWLACSGPPSVTLGEGDTPLVAQSFVGRPVYWKCDYLAPSGSFKDRGVAVMVNYLLSYGITSVTEDSSGNGGASLATYAAAASMECKIYVPEATSEGKLAQMKAAGSVVERISGSRAATSVAAMQDASGAYYASHNWHPLFLEGMKTLGYEIWEQLAEVPDVIVMPVGNGSIVLGIYRAFSDLYCAGLASRVPKLVGVQSGACCPLATAMLTGSELPVAVGTASTVAEGIALSNPVRGRETLAAIRGAGGTIISVAESEIGAAHAELARSGLYVEPTSAVAGAGLRTLLAENRITPEQTVVVVLTGSGLKTGFAK